MKALLKKVQKGFFFEVYTQYYSSGTKMDNPHLTEWLP